MTKLDRASADDEDLKSLSDFYKNINIAPLDLFHVLRRVTHFIISKSNINMIWNFKCIETDRSNLQRYGVGLQVLSP